MKIFILLAFLHSQNVLASYAPYTTLVDTTGANTAGVNSSHELSTILGSDSNVCKETGGNLAAILAALGSPFQAGGSVGNTSFGISGLLPNFASVPTVNLGSLNGAATASAQATAQTSLSSIDTKLTSPIAVTGTLSLSNYALESGGHLASIDTKLGSPFQAGGSIGNSAFGITGTLPAFAATPTFNIGSLNGAATNAELVTINTTLGSPFQAGGAISNTAFGITGTLPAFTATPTFNLGTLNGASTAANQVTAQTSLSSIDSKLTSPITVTGTITTSPNVNLRDGAGNAITSQANSSQRALDVGVDVAGVQVDPRAIRALTSSDTVTVVQPTGTNLHTVIDNTISTKSPVNANATLSARQTVTTTESNLAAPANAVGVLVECESVNPDNLRWGASGSSSAILSSTLGVLCEPGRSEYLPLGTGSFVHLIALAGGSDFVDVQWVLSQ